MPNPSYRLLSVKDRNDILDRFEDIFTDLNSKQLGNLLLSVLTKNEIMMFSKRLAIVKCLRKGLPYGDIKRIYYVGNSTIAKLQEMLQQKNEDELKLLDRLIKNEDLRWKKAQEDRKKAGGFRSSKMVFARKI